MRHASILRPRSPNVWTTLVSIVVLCAAATSLRAGVIAYWKFEPGALTVDSSGNNHTLLNTGVTSGAPTPAGNTGSASFNGSQTQFSTQNKLDLSSSTTLTIEWWANVQSSNAAIFWEHSVDYNNSFGGIIAVSYATATTWEAAQDTHDPRTRRGAPMPVNNTWHHYAVEFDRNFTGSQRIKTFVDGVSVGSPVDSGTTDKLFLNDFFFIGSRNNASVKYTGLMDELRISDQLLTPSQMLLTLPEPTSVGAVGFAGALALSRRRARRA